MPLIDQRTVDKTTTTILSIVASHDDYVFRTNVSPEDRLTLLLFSLAIWRTRRCFYKKDFRRAFIGQAAHGIATAFLSLRASVKKLRRYSSRDRAKDREEFSRKLAALPSTSLRVFTDGSSYGNPGPAGAAFYCLLPSLPSYPKLTPQSTSGR